ncbi:MAG: dephospho-CoA kinase [Bacteroidetes bacterium]|nr:dephospho-CoA kinase [Bacteroidota bacterium]
MLKVGLTGNIGSGKSIIAEIFSSLGVPIYHADRESWQFLFDESVKNKIQSSFGDQVFNPDNLIDRKKLGSVVFSDPEALNTLNGILHPLVIKHFSEWCIEYSFSPYIINEAAIIFESGIANLFDKIIHVSCPKEIAIGRVMKRDGVDGNSVIDRMRFQMEDAVKADLADFVILNSGSEMVIPQVLDIHERLSEISV